MSGWEATCQSDDGMKQWYLSRPPLTKKELRACVASPFTTSGNVSYSC